MRMLSGVAFLVAWLCSPVAAAADGSTGAAAAEERLPESGRPARVVSNLTVNASNTNRMIAVGKCEADGLRDIRALMMESRLEELWAFVPVDESGECRWIEIGEEAWAASANTTVKVDWRYLEKLMARFGILYLYHFHPLAYFQQCAPQPGCNAFSVPTKSGVIPGGGLVTNLQFAMPSAEDIYFMSESVWRYDRARPDGGTLRHRVVSPYGVVEYGLSDAGKSRYRENRGSRMEGLYIKWVAANSLADEHIEGMIERYPDDLIAALRALVAGMNSNNLTVSFSPAE